MTNNAGGAASERIWSGKSACWGVGTLGTSTFPVYNKLRRRQLFQLRFTNTLTLTPSLLLSLFFNSTAVMPAAQKKILVVLTSADTATVSLFLTRQRHHLPLAPSLVY